MTEKRSQQRLRTFKGGSIQYGTAIGIDCIIRNMSSAGACLVVDSSVGIPDDFTLLIRPEIIKRHCRAVWRQPKRLGVRFV
jgi:hypothetical protein